MKIYGHRKWGKKNYMQESTEQLGWQGDLSLT